jgi:hypothetical protein
MPSKPEISKKWWSKEKPADIKGKELEGALGDCEKALAEASKKPDGDTLEKAIDALEAVSDAIEKTVDKECDKKKHKDLIATLEKLGDLVEDKQEELEKAQEACEKEGEDKEEDEEEDGKTVFKPEYLARMIKMLRGGELLQFALGLNKQSPADSKLVLCNKRKPERLYKMLKQTGDFSNRLLTFGTANGDGKILQLNLSDDAKEPSQIVKTAKGFFKGHRDLKYRKIRVIVAGQTFEEDMEGEEGAPTTSSGTSTNTGDLAARLRKAEAAGLAWRKVRESISDQIAQVQHELNGFDDADANSVHDGLSSLVDKLPDPDFDALAKSSDANAFTSNLAKTRSRLAELQKLMAQGSAYDTVDHNPFVKTQIVSTVNQAVASISADLA